MNYNNTVFEISVADNKAFPKMTLPEVCFSGHSNVGKSSLINKLVGRKSLARTSNKPGKTRVINFFRCDKVRFADLPGYGFAKVSKEERMRWGELMESYFASRDISLVFQLIDARHKPTDDDIDMLHYLCDSNLPFVIVLTKCDKLNKTEREESFKLIMDSISFVGDDTVVIPFSSITGEGVDTMRSILEEIAENS